MRVVLLLLLGLSTVTATLLGVSTSTYQIEGQRMVEGSIWDVFAHQAGRIADGSNGDIACDSFHRWEEDVEWVSWLGASVYRFSFSWPRFLMHREEALSYYDGLIDALLARNITPLATISHWDIPQSLQEAYGGWENDCLLDDLEDLARLLFFTYGDRVRHWITLNEPLTVALLGYGNGEHAPGKAEPSRLVYEVAHRMIRAHARLYRLYHREFAGGKIGIALNSDFIQPQDPGDGEAAERALLWRMGWFADPLLLGDYPSEMRCRCGDRLPRFAESVRDTMDFFALNHYTTLEATEEFNDLPNVFSDPQASYRFPPSSAPSASGWLHVYPQGMYGMLAWLDSRYHLAARNLSVIISETGFSSAPEDLEDGDRIAYLNGYWEQATRAAADHGLELEAFCVWSLMDNFEWAAGFTERYGLLHLDRTTLTRTPRQSAHWFRNRTRKHLS